jgi:hypothetical protein
MSLQTNNKTKTNYNFGSLLALAFLMSCSQYLSAGASSIDTEEVGDDDEDDEDDVKDLTSKVKGAVTTTSSDSEKKELEGWRYTVGNRAFLIGGLSCCLGAVIMYAIISGTGRLAPRAP